jgi:hypothetical protein
VLSLKNNALGTKEAGKVLGEMLKENSVLKELDLSDNKYYSGGWKTDPEFAEELAAGIKDNGALTQLDISDNKLAQGEPIKDRWGDITGYEAETAGVLYNTSYHFSWLISVIRCCCSRQRHQGYGGVDVTEFG